ncbi:putative parvovirus NS1 superfamily protein [Psittacine aviadenovirus B]|uniref:Putative parvovirus NS1 superfamily protein n=1 Tax=psittacine adenovirus 4 TaxID=2773287 RepID=A0A1P8SW60_9ADEN|nr:putative parvovirus NS1 superfamily protein [Psittacine aviadenovirus B]APY28339.1 putative parvovirus NS1 superfamily protein [psittacine adenovirus 4]
MPSERWRVVESLMDRGITSTTLWRAVDPAEYDRFKKITRRGWRVEELLQDAVTHLPWSKTLRRYLIGSRPPRFPEGNLLYRVLEGNGYCPRSVGTLLLRWADRLSEKNTLWISGTANSGARALTECIAYLAPVRSSADWRRQNPFCRCCPSTLIWWDHGRVREEHVGLVRQVLSGQYVVFPENVWEEGLLKEMSRTPVLASSDDMCKVLDAAGLEIDDYESMLKSLIYRLHLKEDLPSGERITEAVVKDFFAWIEARPAFAVNESVHELYHC